MRANADTGADAANARELGAEGIGLCRTEHMFLGEDRLPIVREMILADTPEGEAAALEKLLEVQRADFVDVLEAMDGLPVTVRLLDPPLHEFLPGVEELRVKRPSPGCPPRSGAARRRPGVAASRTPCSAPAACASGWSSRASTPCRCGRWWRPPPPGPAGGKPVVEIMIPLTVTREELAEARSWVRGASQASRAPARLDITIGTMVETPRAALRADELAEVADFFCFGTNDLTQMTFGFSRDDVEGRMMPAYLEQGLLPATPSRPSTSAAWASWWHRRRAGPGGQPPLKLGVCGEHGGDPESVAFFQRVGLDYVSCSPFRVPVARLAAAQAIVGAGSVATRRWSTGGAGFWRRRAGRLTRTEGE